MLMYLSLRLLNSGYFVILEHLFYGTIFIESTSRINFFLFSFLTAAGAAVTVSYFNLKFPSKLIFHFTITLVTPI